MNKFPKKALAGAVAIAVAQMASAGTNPYFIPLTDAEIVDLPDGFKSPEAVEEMVPVLDENGEPLVNSDGEIVMEGTGVFFTTDNFVSLISVDERNKPWSVPAGVSQTNLVSMEEVEQGGVGSVVRVDAGNNSSMFDMLAYDPSGENIFIPHETPFGAGVSRYNIADDRMDVIFKGDESAVTRGSAGFNDDSDFGAFDPVRWTPNGTLIAGEEWAGTGRIVEICDPYSTPHDPNAPALRKGNCETDPSADWRVLDGLPLAAQEGIFFSETDPQGVMYFVDEDRSGSIYKAKFTTKGEYNKAQTYVLSVNAYKNCVDKAGCDPAERWDSGETASSTRTGLAKWVPITDKNGKPLPGVQDPTENLLDANGNIIDPGQAGRDAADDVSGTPYGRPEDATIGFSNRGYELIYFTATSENAIYSIEETSDGPVVRVFANGDTPTNLGFPATNASLNSPDNLAIDKKGNIYVIEDSPNTTQVGAAGGDIWFARDVNQDGVAESLDHFMSLQVPGSEATGMIFSPKDPYKFVVAVQHPRSTGLSDEDESLLDTAEDSDGKRSSIGFGDAIWEFDVRGAHRPTRSAKQ